MTLTPSNYKPRLIDPLIERLLDTFGAVSIEGPKWSGKTWTAKNHSNSMFGVADTVGPISNVERVMGNVKKALEGDAPHLIDEWQEVPRIWDAVRISVDESVEKGRYILTGSSVPRRDEYIHSGAGRIATIEMNTMSLFESGDSSGLVSLRDILENNLDMVETGAIDIEQIADYMIRGGWPGSLNLKNENQSLVPLNYLKAAIQDACRLDGKVRNSEKMMLLLKSLARNESTLASDASLQKDMKKYDEDTLSLETMSEYHDCLNRIHLLKETPSFRPNVRSDMRIGKKPKRHLIDVSLAIAILGLNREKLISDLNTFGFMFESLCEHDLEIYAESIGGKLFHYRDGRDREIDAIIETSDGEWAAFEIKLGARQIDAAAKNLLNMKSLFEKEGKAPKSLCVICGMSEYAYTRPDGVHVVPITSLRP